MHLPITIGLHRSRFLGMGMLAGHLLAAIVVSLPPWPLLPKGMLLAGLTASAALCWQKWPPPVKNLRLLSDGRLECELPGESGFEVAELLPGATVHPWLTVVRLRLADRKRVLVVLPDSTKAANFRRLRVWLRWRAGFSAPKNDA